MTRQIHEKEWDIKFYASINKLDQLNELNILANDYAYDALTNVWSL